MVLRWVLSAALCISLHAYGAIVLKGDSNAVANETFSFQIQGNAISTLPDIVGMNVYVTAQQNAGGAGTVNEFSVARVARNSTEFIGLTPKEASFNMATKDAANPLYDKGIVFFSLFNGQDSNLKGANERPVVVLGDRQTIYMINNSNTNGLNSQVITVHNNNIPINQLTSVMNIPDATAAVTSGIVGLTTANPFIFAATGANGGSFGDVGSGIALAVIGVVNSGKANEFTGPLIVDGPTGSFMREAGNRATALDISSTQLKIGADLASIGTVVDLHWNRSVGRLYIALQITGGAAGTDGGRAIAVGRIENKTRLIIDAIVPAVAITGTNKIIGAIGSSAEVSMHKVRSIFTTTALPYLIVAGGVGSPSTTRRTVFALPLVSGTENELINGTIADKDAEPENIFLESKVDKKSKTVLFTNRVITQPATTAAEVPLSTDAATQVGGGALLNGDITDMFVYQDTVFVSVQTAAANQAAGVFYSQPLFEQNGKVKGWTTWRRAVGLPNHVQSVLVDPCTGQFTTLVANSSDEVTIVQRTEWKEGDANGLSPVAGTLDNFMPQAFGGVQGIHDFIITDTSLDTTTPGLLDISLLVATGLDNVALFETSRVQAGAVLPTSGPEFGPLAVYENGTLTQTFPVGGTKMMGVQGGTLSTVGPLVAAEVARDGSGGSNGWLFVGGVHGVAVLSQADGSGWNPASGLSTGFTGLVVGMSFKQVGDFSHVRKLINDGQYLYVLTLDSLVRIDLTVQNPGVGQIAPTTVATVSSIPGVSAEGSFLDVIISEKLVLLATSDGLFRAGNGHNVQTDSIESMEWEIVPTPEGSGPVRQLFAISKTGRAQDVARSVGGGMIYALSAYQGKNQAQLFRYDIAQVITGSITDNTVRRIDDLFVENIPSYFSNFGTFRNNFATDGSLFYGTRSQSTGTDSFASILFSKEGIQTGSRFVSNKMVPVNLAESTQIAGMIQNSASGSWIIAGDHGLRINE